MTAAVRHAMLIREKEKMKAEKKEVMVNSEIQRTHVKNALHHMSVWNTFDESVIHTIIHKSPQKLSVEEPTVDEMVRLTVHGG
jgi:hypothetical protein